jgi:hypothetical protein
LIRNHRKESFVVSAKNLYHDKVILRVVSEEKPNREAVATAPNLNDAYLYQMAQKEESGRDGVW